MYCSDKTEKIDIYISSHDGNPNYIFDIFEIIPNLDNISKFKNLENDFF